MTVTIKDDLHLSKIQVANSNIVSLVATYVPDSHTLLSFAADVS